VPLPAVELDDLFGARPVAIDLELLWTDEDPGVEAGHRQAMAAEEGREAFLQL
jgi:hypothetical protein